MAKTPVTEKIGDSTFKFYPMSPVVSVKMFARLTKLIGETAVRVLATAAMPGEENSKAKVVENFKSQMSKESREDLIKTLTDSFRSFADRLDEDGFLDMLKQMVATVEVQRPGDNGLRRLDFELDFAGRVPELLIVFKKSVEVEYGDFLGVLA